MEPKKSMDSQGPEAYANWKGMAAGHKSEGALEFTLYTDANITGDISEGYGPYQLINTIAHSVISRLKPSIVLRIEDHTSASPPLSWESKTDYSRYHGGRINDELAALVSLCLGIRLNSGNYTRRFECDGDARGRPVAWDGFDAPVLPPLSDAYVLPYALGSHRLEDIAPLL